MGLCLLGVLMLLHLHNVLIVGEVVSHSELGQSDQFGFLKSFVPREDFGDGSGVKDRDTFCRDLEACFLSGFCLCAADERSWQRIGEGQCVEDCVLCDRIVCHGFPVSFSQDVVIRLLMSMQEKASDQSQLNQDKQDYIVSSSGYNVSLAIPGMLLMCCALCPCFRSRKKDPSKHHVLSSELSQTNSVSSSETGSIFERIPASPFRFPASPITERIPGSPLKAPASPARFLRSPQLNRSGSVNLSIIQIMKATQNFSPSLKLGEDGFGTVYKAILPDGQVVAVKRAKKEHIAALQDEFSNEVELLAKIDHRNLVKLIGYSNKGKEQIIVIEYVRNGTLREHLDGLHGKILDFNQRLEISIDVAHGLTYLHMYAEKTIIHRDVKSSNILLTENFRAKVSDFGFARFGPTADQTHIMTKIKGTAGYLDPEYLKTYQLTAKSDVFSFGILLLEILSARRPVEPKRQPDDRILVRWAFRLYNEGRQREILDPLLIEVVDGEVLSKIVGLAFQCSAPTRADRPSMKDVGEQLWEIRRDYRQSRTSG